MSLTLVALLIAASGVGAFQTQSASGPAADRSMLRIVAVEIQPAGRSTSSPAYPPATPDTLYQLRVKIRNNGSEPASDLAFQIAVNGQRLAPYVNHNFRTDLSPGKETDVQLYNFWSSEAGRPFPKDGRLVVEVRLTGARWMGAGSTPTRDVQPLPVPYVVTLTSKTNP